MLMAVNPVWNDEDLQQHVDDMSVYDLFSNKKKEDLHIVDRGAVGASNFKLAGETVPGQVLEEVNPIGVAFCGN